MYRIIQKKRRGAALSKEEIEYVVAGYTTGEIPDYQMSALLMAICLNGMNKEETLYLTLAMANSGEILDLSSINGIKADKHSTGGVGDKTSLIVAPIAAAYGVKIAKMSGRGLGHTGGTIDKLESINGFRTDLSNDEFIAAVNRTGLSIVGQSIELAPADKRIYALRDVTATVDSIPLIASSIMSKKLAAGSDVIVLDVKSGSGAFMKNPDEAVELAEQMVKIGMSAGKKMYALISDMNEPLGRFIGNRLEVLEAVNALKGIGDEDLFEDCYYLSALILLGAGIVPDINAGLELSRKTVREGKALDRFREFVISQGGDAGFIDEPGEFLKVNKKICVNAEETGYVSEIDAELFGLASMYLGGGREKKEDIIDFNVGIRIEKKLGDFVQCGDTLATLYVNSEKNLARAVNAIKSAYLFTDKLKSDEQKHIYGYFIGENYIKIQTSR